MPLPKPVKPMLARPGPLPPDDGRWGYEVKWDGIRALAYVAGGRIELRNRSGRDITSRYPDLGALGGALAGRDAVLDGEIAAFDEDGRPSFERLQHRMHLASDAAVRWSTTTNPVAYVIFDLLQLDGRALLAEPYAARRELLDGLGLNGPAWQTPRSHVGDGAALLEATRRRGLEGIVAKRLDCPYEPGRRSAGWIKVKNTRRATLVVGGFLPGEGARSGRVGALLVGYHEEGGLRYAGRVGSGFSEAMLARLDELLAPLRLPESPFDGRQPPRGSVFAEPRLVADVEFADWTRTRTLRAPRFKGLRDDVEADAVGFDPGA